MNIMSTQELGAIVETIKPVPSFFRNLFFGRVKLSTAKTVVIDKKVDVSRVSPFVHPNQKGNLVEQIGFTSDTLEPAYLKDERRFNPNAALVRGFGEALTGALTPSARITALVREQFLDQLRMFGRRIEVMCAEAIVSATQTIKGVGFDTAVSFGRAGGNAYQATVLWSHQNAGGEYDADVQGDLEDAARTVSLAGGGTPVVVMDYKAYKLFSKNKYVMARDGKWIPSGLLKSSIIDPAILVDGEAKFMGMYGDLEIWVYNFQYMDPVTKALTNVMPDNTVIVAGLGLQGIQHFGMVQNMKSMAPVENFASMWDEDDGSARWIKLESAPLMQPGIPNATVKITVHA